MVEQHEASCRCDCYCRGSNEGWRACRDWEWNLKVGATTLVALVIVALIAWGATVHATREHEIRLAKIRACPVAEE